ncbi:MAG: DNA-processing protein DprA [Kiritimatiellae bacterium]|nr:DNA-processing protein DprA [Kiritimatiellia bacterium]
MGFATVSELAASAGSVAAAWELYPKKVSRSGGDVDWEGEFRLAAKFGVSIVTPADAGYPARLRNAPGRPLALYVKGDVAALSAPSVALVGTRRATSYGRDMANKLAFGLAKAGWSVVSGLALGIDAESHRGALDAGGVTVGVIGSGLDQFYPEENRALAREIASHGGAVVSEFPFGRPPDRETFPIRNHVVAALAQGVVAVEAPARSGTLITTSIAADLGRTVMAVPARADSRQSAGCLQLIRDGAVLVRNVDDVLEAMSELIPRKAPPGAASASASAPAADPEAPPYSVEEALVMLHVDGDGVSVDEIVRKTRLPAERVNAVVMGLRIKGFVRYLPGNRVATARGR